MSSIDEVTRPDALGDGRFRWVVPDGWQQGRGAFGGLVIAALCRAGQVFEGDSERAPRSMNAELVGPVMPGDAEVKVELLRRGSAVTTVSVSLAQEGEVRARASFVLGGARRDPTRFPDAGSGALPSAPWSEVPVLPMRPGTFPVFAGHFEFRPTGPMPFTRGSDARAGGWLRARPAPERFSHAEVATYADVWWPAGFSVEAAPRPIATIAFHLQWLHDPALLVPDEPLLCLSRVIGGEGGYVAETRELFAPSGALVALNQQTFVWI